MSPQPFPEGFFTGAIVNFAFCSIISVYFGLNKRILEVSLPSLTMGGPMDAPAVVGARLRIAYAYSRRVRECGERSAPVTIVRLEDLIQ